MVIAGMSRSRIEPRTLLRGRSARVYREQSESNGSLHGSPDVNRSTRKHAMAAHVNAPQRCQVSENERRPVELVGDVGRDLLAEEQDTVGADRAERR